MAYVTGETAARELFYNFPSIFAQAQKDWAKFKLGRQQGLFNKTQAGQVWEWFKDFPRLWETVRPNWSENISASQRNWGARVDAFVAEIKRNGGLSGFGFGPAAIVIAGIAIVGGVTAATWGIGYIKKQANLSKLIEGVTAGRLPEAALVEATKEKPTLFGDVAGLIKWIVIGGAALLVLTAAAGVRRRD